MEIGDWFTDSSPSGTPEKKQKVAAYKIGAEQKKRIAQDSINKKLWDEAMEHTAEGGQVGPHKSEKCQKQVGSYKTEKVKDREVHIGQRKCMGRLRATRSGQRTCQGQG